MKIFTTMKNCSYRFSFFLVLFNFIIFTGNAQQIADEKTYLINQYFQNINTNEISLIENNKLVNFSNFSQVDYAKLNQVGNNNQIDIRSDVGNSQTVSQLGNGNNYEFISYYNSNISNFNIIQQGNSNSLQIYGENSLIKNISIFQKADFGTLIIKNY